MKNHDVFFAQEPLPQSTTQTLFLAGPSPRAKETENWRLLALELLKELDFKGQVFIPLLRDGSIPKNYIDQAEWEQNALNRSDVILFWIPRNLDSLPGFTTNVEFGQRVKFRNIILGYPKDAPKMSFLKFLANENFVEQHHDLKSSLVATLTLLGPPALREGGECDVPAMIWRLPHFQSWLQSQKAAGNRLDGASLEMAFGVGPQKKFLLYWAMHVNIYVASEKRYKSNEIVVGRPDIKHTVGYYRNGKDPFQTKIALIREFRSTANTEDGFIREVPGGSGMKKENALETAAAEFQEETGIVINPDRLRPLAPRQLGGTTTSHKAHCFALEMTESEMQEYESSCLIAHGNVEETERCYNEVYTLRELLDHPITDWANLGMIISAVMH